MKDVNVVVLAAGAGTRMKSKLPKVLHKIAGVPLVGHVIDTLEESNLVDISVVVGHGREQVEPYLQTRRDINIVYQAERLGTGHAVMMAESRIQDDKDILILTGDTPLLRAETIKNMMKFHSDNDLDAVVLTAYIDNPYGYGRIVKNTDGFINEIVEHKDCTMEQLKINEINSGIICVKGSLLNTFLKKLKTNNSQSEYYLTDVIGLLTQNGYKVGAFVVDDNTEIIGINDREQLSMADDIFEDRIKKYHMKNGVTFINQSSIYIEKYVEIGNDTIIENGSILRGTTKIGSDCVISNSDIKNTIIRDNVCVKNSTLIDSMVDDSTNVGPYAYLRPKSVIGKNVKIGDFVEVKNSNVGDNTKVSHLTYIGDGDVGEGVNIGCGVVFVNYDGTNKHRTKVEDGAFVGCNVNLVAPVTVENGAYVAAGSTITKDVVTRSLGIARAKQRNIENWVDRKAQSKK